MLRVRTDAFDWVKLPQKKEPHSRGGAKPQRLTMGPVQKCQTTSK